MPIFSYQALGPLPSAGTSRAFLGLAILDESRAEPVVLVWVPDEIAADVEKSERIQRETERVALLEHPHIVRVYGFARFEDGRLARVVEYADGENLRRILGEAGPLPPPFAARLIADAAQGVHYAHLAGNDDGTPLLHGDLRPETLLVSFNGNCKVAGYGAAAFAPKENQGRSLRVAPEQVLGGRAAMNVQTDIYLLGATLYEAITGKAPFEGEADFEQAVLGKEVDVSGLPEGLGQVVRRAMAKKAQDRYPSALLFREAVELSGLSLPEHPEIGSWLKEKFPDEGGARAERQRVIDAGIANFARSQWDKQAAAPSARPPFPVIAAPPAAPAPAPPPAAAPEAKPAPATQPAQTTPSERASALTPSAPEPEPVRQRPIDPEDSQVHEPPEPRRTGVKLAIAAALVLGALATWWAVSQREGEGAYPPGVTTRAEAEDAGSSLPVNAAAGSVTDGGASAEAPLAADAGGSAASPLTANDGAADAGSAAASEAPRGVLALKVEPAVNVEVDGKPVGRAPVKVAVAPGRRRVRLFDKRRGVELTRVINVSAQGVTSEEIFLQKGFVSVNAPPGAIVEIDGKRVGKAPLTQEISLYEGSHTVVVTMGKSKWREGFTVKPNQRVYFDVGPQYR